MCSVNPAGATYAVRIIFSEPEKRIFSACAARAFPRALRRARVFAIGESM
jgi:hypothetical protein